MRDLHILPLTREAFADYGEVLDIDGVQATPINAGRALRYHALAHPATDADGRIVLSIVHSQASSLPCELKSMECHPAATQAFIPLQSQAMVIIVARAGTEPQAANLHAFMSQPGQGINYFAGTWHYPLLPLGQAGNFLVVDRDDPDNNCKIAMLNETVRLLY